jgi:hypothetical protein
MIEDTLLSKHSESPLKSAAVSLHFSISFLMKRIIREALIYMDQRPKDAEDSFFC